MTVKQIVQEWLSKNGYAGLCGADDKSCGCTIDDLFCCCDVGIEGESIYKCEPAYEHTKQDCKTCGAECECSTDGYYPILCTKKPCEGRLE